MLQLIAWIALALFFAICVLAEVNLRRSGGYTSVLQRVTTRRITKVLDDADRQMVQAVQEQRGPHWQDW